MVCHQTDASFHSKKEENHENYIFLKMNVLSQIPLFFETNAAKNIFLPKFATTAYNMKRVLMIVLYFHVLNIAKFG